MAESGTLFDALDLPPQAQPLQDAYWKARSEWEALSASYEASLNDLLARVGKPS